MNTTPNPAGLQSGDPDLCSFGRVPALAVAAGSR